MSTTALMETVKKRKAADLRLQEQRYREILDTGLSSNSDELLKLSEALGKSLDDVESDITFLAQWKNLESLVNQAIADDVENRHRAALADLTAFRVQTDAIAAQRAAEDKRLDQIELDLRMDSMRLGGNIERLQKLQQKHHSLLWSKHVPRI